MMYPEESAKYETEYQMVHEPDVDVRQEPWIMGSLVLRKPRNGGMPR